METLKEYLLSVTAASILCAIILSLPSKKGTVGSMIKLISGLFLTAVVVRPVFTLKTVELGQYLQSIQADAQSAVDAGRTMADEETEKCIITQMQSYISSKAESMDMQIDVEVTLRDMIPWQVQISGNVSPYDKVQLSAWIEEELGIPAEDQVWN